MLEVKFICARCLRTLQPGEVCTCKTQKNTSTSGKGILYICDRRACEHCNPDCHHTSDIKHAKNFELSFDIFVEQLGWFMKLSYYIFSMEHKIENCGQCPN